MKKYEGNTFEGERALFSEKDLQLENCIFCDGESPLKHSRNIKMHNCVFEWKYPLWYAKNIEVRNSVFKLMSRSGIWYTEKIKVSDSTIIAPKEFRRSKYIELENIDFKDASETLWECEHIKMRNVKAKGDYLMMNSKDIEVDQLILDGNYVFDGAKKIKIKNSILNSKDSFWNTEDVYIENCEIRGEYFGWNSKNMTLVNCTIESLQGFCFIKNLKLVNCKLENTTLAFEYSEVDAKILTTIDSVKNPLKGIIRSKGIKELIIDENCKDPKATKFEVL